MTDSRVIQFPRKPTTNDQPWTEEEWREFMLDLHARLFEALERDSGDYTIALSLDDVLEMIQAIEFTVGYEHFDDQTS